MLLLRLGERVAIQEENDERMPVFPLLRTVTPGGGLGVEPPGVGSKA